MPELLTDPGFENGIGWTYGSTTGLWSRSAASTARTGDYLAYGFSLPAGDPAVFNYLTSENITVTTGERYGFACYRRHGSSGTDEGQPPLRMEVDPGDGTFYERKEYDSRTNTRWLFSGIAAFDAVGTTARVRLRVPDGSGVAAGRTWLIDDCTVRPIEELVAIKLAERSVDAVESLLQTNLATELTAIDTDRGDGVTMAAPASGEYYKREKVEISGATAHVEIFERDFDFINPYTDADAQRAVYELPLTIRVTCFNRDGDTADTMHKRRRRYAAGVFNVINKNHNLGDSDDATQNIVIEGVESEADVDEAGSVLKVTSTLRALVRCEEVQT